jgi:hypothetical protein
MTTQRATSENTGFMAMVSGIFELRKVVAYRVSAVWSLCYITIKRSAAALGSQEERRFLGMEGSCEDDE